MKRKRGKKYSPLGSDTFRGKKIYKITLNFNTLKKKDVEGEIHHIALIYFKPKKKYIFLGSDI